MYGQDDNNRIEYGICQSYLIGWEYKRGKKEWEHMEQDYIRMM